MDTGAYPKGELPSPAWGQHGGAGLQDFWSSCLWVTSGGREAPGSFGFRQEAACSYLPCPSCALCPEALGGAPAWRAPRWGQSLQLQTSKPWLRDQGQAQPLSWPPRPWRNWGCNAPECRKQGSDMGSDLHFLSPAFRMCGPNLGLENAMAAEE